MFVLSPPRLTYVDATHVQVGVGDLMLKASRGGGNPWVPARIAAPITVDNGELSPSGLFYLYARDVNGALEAAFSPTGHVMDPAYGIEVQNDDATRALIGMVLTNGSSQFVDSVAARQVRSWGAGIPLIGRSKFTQARTLAGTSPGIAMTEIHNETRLNFLAWDRELLHVDICLSIFTSEGAGAVVTQLMLLAGSLREAIENNAYSQFSTPNFSGQEQTVLYRCTADGDGLLTFTIGGAVKTPGSVTGGWGGGDGFGEESELLVETNGARM